MDIKEKINLIKKTKNTEHMITCLIEVSKGDAVCVKCNNKVKIKAYYFRKTPTLIFKDNKLYRIFFKEPRLRCTKCNYTVTYTNKFFKNKEIDFETFYELAKIL